MTIAIFQRFVKRSAQNTLNAQVLVDFLEQPSIRAMGLAQRLEETTKNQNRAVFDEEVIFIVF